MQISYLKRNKLLHGSWAFSVYNLTGRKNAYSIYFKSENGAEIKFGQKKIEQTHKNHNF